MSELRHFRFLYFVHSAASAKPFPERNKQKAWEKNQTKQKQTQNPKTLVPGFHLRDG